MWDGTMFRCDTYITNDPLKTLWEIPFSAYNRSLMMRTETVIETSILKRPPRVVDCPRRLYQNYFLSWWRRERGSLKSWQTSTRPHGVTKLKTAILVMKILCCLHGTIRESKQLHWLETRETGIVKWNAVFISFIESQHDFLVLFLYHFLFTRFKTWC